MTTKYQVTNQLTGLPHEATTWEDAIVLQTQIRNEYMAHVEPCFTITALIQNEDGSITQMPVDQNGEPIYDPTLSEQNT